MQPHPLSVGGLVALEGADRPGDARHDLGVQPVEPSRGVRARPQHGALLHENIQPNGAVPGVASGTRAFAVKSYIQQQKLKPTTQTSHVSALAL